MDIHTKLSEVLNFQEDPIELNNDIIGISESSPQSDSDSDGDIIRNPPTPEDPERECYQCVQCEAYETHSLLDLYKHKQDCGECIYCLECGTNLSIKPVTDKIIENVELLVEEYKDVGTIPIVEVKKPKESKKWFKELMDVNFTYDNRDSCIDCVDLLTYVRHVDGYHRITAGMLKTYLMYERSDVKHVKAKYNKSSYYKGISKKHVTNAKII